VVVGAGVHGLQIDRLVAVRGQDNERLAAALCPGVAEQVDPAADSQPVIDQRDVIVTAQQPGKAGLIVLHPVEREPA
jgi:hypothetical protein